VSTALQRRAYTFFAPWYDLWIESATRQAREESLKRLRPGRDVDLLLCGAGSGLDLPHLPAGSTATALDVTPAMLQRARSRANLVLAPFLTRTDVVFEDVLSAVPGLRVTDDRPALLGGWFRFITLERTASPEPGLFTGHL
jgi:ubiquinone/menaquinone biosynthesis C-methylase UbiE